MKNNIFDFLRISRKETIHSQFIVSVMQENPLYLDMFFEIIGCKDYVNSDNSFKPKTEVTLFNKKNSLGRADIWIGNTVNNGRKRIIIENKIYASDQYQQMKRYRDYLDDKDSGRDNGLLYYLTLEEKPANISSSGLKKNNDLVSNNAQLGYERISYHNHIIPWLNRVYKDKSASKHLTYFIEEYKNALNSLTRTQVEVKNGKNLADVLENDRFEFGTLLELYFWNFLVDMININNGNIDSRRRYSYDKIYKRQKSDYIEKAYGLIIGNVRIKVCNEHKSNDLIFSKGYFNQEGVWVDNDSFDRFKLKLSNISNSEECASKVYEILKKSNM